MSVCSSNCKQKHEYYEQANHHHLFEGNHRSLAEGKSNCNPRARARGNGGTGADLHSFKRCRNGCLYQEEVKSVLCHFVSIASTNQALYDIPKFLHIFR